MPITYANEMNPLVAGAAGWLSGFGQEKPVEAQEHMQAAGMYASMANSRYQQAAQQTSQGMQQVAGAYLGNYMQQQGYQQQFEMAKKMMPVQLQQAHAMQFQQSTGIPYDQAQQQYGNWLQQGNQGDFNAFQNAMVQQRAAAQHNQMLMENGLEAYRPWQPQMDQISNDMVEMSRRPPETINSDEQQQAMGQMKQQYDDLASRPPLYRQRTQMNPNDSAWQKQHIYTDNQGGQHVFYQTPQGMEVKPLTRGNVEQPGSFNGDYQNYLKTVPQGQQPMGEIPFIEKQSGKTVKTYNPKTGAVTFGEKNEWEDFNEGTLQPYLQSSAQLQAQGVDPKGVLGEPPKFADYVKQRRAVEVAPNVLVDPKTGHLVGTPGKIEVEQRAIEAKKDIAESANALKEETADRAAGERIQKDYEHLREQAVKEFGATPEGFSKELTEEDKRWRAYQQMTPAQVEVVKAMRDEHMDPSEAYRRFVKGRGAASATQPAGVPASQPAATGQAAPADKIAQIRQIAQEQTPRGLAAREWLRSKGY
jgi:hypothetical protein